jgi:hypothetical protein
MPTPDQMFSLFRHPINLAPMVLSLNAGVTYTEEGGLVFSYHLRGDMVRLLIPAPQTKNHSDALWEHTCFEAFVAVAGSTAYEEFNFSPSGQWAAYTFSDYRQANKNRVLSKAPQISTHLSAGRLDLVAIITQEALPPNIATTTLQIGLSAVIESTDTVDGNRSYWALRHPTPRPDFHHRNGFVLELTAP